MAHRGELSGISTAQWLCTYNFVNSFTFLGHVINQEMADDVIKKQTTKPTVTGSALLRRFSCCSQRMKLEATIGHGKTAWLCCATRCVQRGKYIGRSDLRMP